MYQKHVCSCSEVRKLLYSTYSSITYNQLLRFKNISLLTQINSIVLLQWTSIADLSENVDKGMYFALECSQNCDSLFSAQIEILRFAVV